MAKNLSNLINLEYKQFNDDSAYSGIYGVPDYPEGGLRMKQIFEKSKSGQLVGIDAIWKNLNE